MSERDEFLAWVNAEMRDAEVALHNGDAGPRRRTWSQEEPVSVFGAWMTQTGLEDVAGLFTRLEAVFSGCRSFELEMVAADVIGDMAYTVAYEHTSATVDGEARDYTLRATQVYRREGGAWRVAHRHADTLSEDG